MADDIDDLLNAAERQFRVSKNGHPKPKHETEASLCKVGKKPEQRPEKRPTK